MDVNKLTDAELNSIDMSKVLKTQDTDKAKKPKSFAKWEKPPTLEDLKYDLNQTLVTHKAMVANVDKWLKLYKAERLPKKEGHTGSRITPKLIRKQGEWRIPAFTEPFLSTSNLFDVQPVTFEDVSRARQNALILNRQFSTQIPRVAFIDKLVRKLTQEGTSIARVGWEYTYKEKEVTENVYEYQPVPMGSPMAEQLTQQYQELLELRETHPNSYEMADEATLAGLEYTEEQAESIGEQMLYQAVFSGTEKSKQRVTLTNKPTIDVCNSKNVYIDPSCEGDLHKARFIIHSFETSLSELKASGQYDNLDQLEQGITGDTRTDIEHTESTDISFNFRDKARKRIVVYEYWGYRDVDDTGIVKPIVVSWVNNTIIRMQDNPYPFEQLPFVIINYIPSIDGGVYGEPDAVLLEDNQELLGALMRGFVDLLGKSANSQTGYPKGLLDATARRNFDAGKNYEYTPGIGNPATAIVTHKFPEVPQTVMGFMQYIQNEAEALSGVKSFGAGGLSSSSFGDVAAGINGVLDAVAKRELSILRRISAGIIEIGRMIVAMNSVFLNEEETVRITNSNFVTVRRDDLQGNFDLDLTISTAEADNAKAQEITMMIQSMGQHMGVDIMMQMMAEFAELRKMPALAQQIRDYKPEPDPVAQKREELEQAKMEAETNLINAQAAEAQAKSQVQGAKVAVEQARADDLSTRADKNALDFTERSNGMEHARKKELQTEKHQQDMEKQVLNQSMNAMDADVLQSQQNTEIMPNTAGA